MYDKVSKTCFCLHATSKLDIFAQIADAVFCSCALKELETLGKDLYGAKLILQRFQVRKCAHFKSPVPASECLLSMLEKTNPHHFFVATQVCSVWCPVIKIMYYNNFFKPKVKYY